MTANENEKNNSSGVAGNALAKILNQLNAPTLITIMLMGGGNLFQGIQSSASNHDEIERAIKEVHQLYSKIDDTEQRQLKGMANQQILLESAHQSLQNQEKMLQLIRKTQKQYLDSRGLPGGDQAPPF